MKPRRKKEIEKEIERGKYLLDTIIEESIDREKTEVVVLQKQRERLKELRAEVSFEDTFEGKIQEAEKVALGKIEAILKELSGVTGMDYLRKMSLEELFGVEEYMA